MQPQRLPDSLPAGIDVFQLALDLDAPLSDADWALLSEEEGVRALRFLRHGDKVRFVVTRAALRRLLGARLRRRPQTLRFVTNSYGKPRLEAACSSNPAIFFNVSHAGSFALIALSIVATASGVRPARLYISPRPTMMSPSFGCSAAIAS